MQIISFNTEFDPLILYWGYTEDDKIARRVQEEHPSRRELTLYFISLE